MFVKYENLHYGIGLCTFSLPLDVFILFLFFQTPHKESDPTDPWTQIANFKLLAEKSLLTIPDLKYTILRPGIVYGLGDKTGISKYFRHIL